MTLLYGPTKQDCPDGCGKFGTLQKSTGHVRGCPCEPCSRGWGVTPKRKRVRPVSAKKAATDDDGWAEARAEALDRTGGSCEVDTPWCPEGPHRADHVHHRLPRQVTRGWGPRRHAQHLLLCVCEPAHHGIHNISPALAYERGWLLHSWDADSA